MEAKKYNKLINEKSPYLLQHVDNPVNWYPWGEEALKKAESEDKPILISIGYSTCHWCHVMAHEAFSDEETADFLNENFVCIKVDREERPDLDDTYMLACQVLTGSGGWPLNVFLTPDKVPFFAGTYFPIATKYNMPSFMHVLKQLNSLWKNDRQKVLDSAQNILDEIKQSQENELSNIPDINIFTKALNIYKRIFDEYNGGFGSAPKFPTPHNISYLLGLYEYNKDKKALDMAQKILIAMYKGGIFDHVAGGFHRYSVDSEWLVPHFEKMLYDQALISIAYIEAFQVTEVELYEKVARRTLDYLIKELKDYNGGFYSGTDADSEGVEGKFFVWKKQEIDEILEQDSKLFSKIFGVTEKGNFENGQNILNINGSINQLENLNECLDRLYDARNKRIKPHLDDKIITSWNGLVIKALALGSKVFNEKKYLNSAIECFDFIEDKLTTSEGKLLRRYRDGESSINGFLEDYVFLTYGLIELYESTFNNKYLNRAFELTDIVINDFYDLESKGFLNISKSSEVPLVNMKDSYDGAIPSANSILFLVMLKLSVLCEKEKFLSYAEEIMSLFSQRINDNPTSHSQMLKGLLYYRVKISGINYCDEDGCR